MTKNAQSESTMACKSCDDHDKMCICQWPVKCSWQVRLVYAVAAPRSSPRPAEHVDQLKSSSSDCFATRLSARATIPRLSTRRKNRPRRASTGLSGEWRRLDRDDFRILEHGPADQGQLSRAQTCEGLSDASSPWSSSRTGSIHRNHHKAACRLQRVGRLKRTCRPDR